MERTFVAETQDGKQRDIIYPAKDPEFNLILRRIVRGLAYEHKLAEYVSDKQVFCDFMPYRIPPSFEAEMTWEAIAPDFIEYGYHLFEDETLHSFWVISFYGHIKFFGRVAKIGHEGAVHAV